MMCYEETCEWCVGKRRGRERGKGEWAAEGEGRSAEPEADVDDMFAL
jgi:hypothetical protein